MWKREDQIPTQLPHHALEWQPSLFDSCVTQELRYELAKLRRALFVRHNLIEAKVKALQEENEFLKANIVNMAKGS